MNLLERVGVCFVEKAKHPWYPIHIVISSKGERVPVGDFLTEDDKKFIEKMDEIIREIRVSLAL